MPLLFAYIYLYARSVVVCVRERARETDALLFAHIHLHARIGGACVCGRGGGGGCDDLFLRLIANWPNILQFCVSTILILISSCSMIYDEEIGET